MQRHFEKDEPERARKIARRLEPRTDARHAVKVRHTFIRLPRKALAAAHP